MNKHDDHTIPARSGPTRTRTEGELRRRGLRAWGRLVAVTGLLVLAGAVLDGACAQTCIDYGQYIRRVSGTALPGVSYQGALSGGGRVESIDHPFAPGHAVALCTIAHNDTLTAIDITDPLALDQPRDDDDVIGTLKLAGVSGDMVLDPDFPARPYLYMCLSGRNIQVVEVGDADPLDPGNIDLTFTIVGYLPGGGSGSLGPAGIGVQVRGGRTIVFEYNSGNASQTGVLNVFDVTDPTAPTTVSATYTGLGTTSDLQLNGNTAYVIHHLGGLIIDITDPAAPAVLGPLGIAEGGQMLLDPGSNTLFVTNGKADPLSAGEYSLRVFDVSVPTAPVMVADAGQAEGFESANGGMVLQNGLLYFASTDGINVADVADRTQPHLIGRAEAGGDGGRFATALYGDYAYSIGQARGLQVVDVSTPESPAPLGNIPGATSSVQALGDLLVSGTGKVYDIGDPTAPVELSTISAHGDAALVDHYAFTATSTTISVWDLIDPTAPTLLATAPGGHWNSQVEAWHADGSPLITVWGVGDNGTPLYTFDPANPGAFAQTDGTFGGRAYDLEAQCGNLFATYAHIQWRLAGSNLTHQYDPTPDVDVRAFCLRGNLLYFEDEFDGIHILDVTDSSAPYEIGFVALQELRHADTDLTVADGILYALQGLGGMYVVDVSDPSSPTPIGSINPAGAGADALSVGPHRQAETANGVVYVADGNNGILILPAQCHQSQYSDSHSITATAGPGGSISPSGVVDVYEACPGYHPYVITPDVDYQIEDVVVDGMSVGPQSDYVFTEVASDRSIHATFTLIPVANMLQDFAATTAAEGVRLSWAWNDPDGILGTEVERADDQDGPWLALEAPVRLENGELTLIDGTAPPGRTVWYRLAVTMADGGTEYFGPVVAESATRAFFMGPAQPNPTGSTASVQLSLPAPDHVRVAVFDVRGRVVAVLADGVMEAGRHDFVWTGRTSAGRAAAGLYFVRAQNGRGAVTRSVVLTR